MKILLAFESKTFLRQLVAQDSPELIKFILNSFCTLCLLWSKYPSKNFESFYDTYLDELYYTVLFESSLQLRCIGEESEVTDQRARLKEIFDACVNSWFVDMLSSVKDIQSRKMEINTFRLVRYDQNSFVILLDTTSKELAL